MGNCKSLFGRSKACSAGVVFSAVSYGGATIIAPRKIKHHTESKGCWLNLKWWGIGTRVSFWIFYQFNWSCLILPCLLWWGLWRQTRKTIQEILLTKTCLPINDGMYDYTFRQWSVVLFAKVVIHALGHNVGQVSEYRWTLCRYSHLWGSPLL